MLVFLLACNTVGAESGLVVHEWGTFTTVNTSSGEMMAWQPLLGPEELPSFVYTNAENIPRLKYADALVRMETPVVYFHTPTEMTASLTVDFRDGYMSEWYPKATASVSRLGWDNFKLVPPTTARKQAFPNDQSGDRYYEARNVNAAAVVTGGEAEQYLFYRGLGHFQLPIQARVTDGSVNISGVPSPILYQRVGAAAALVEGSGAIPLPSQAGSLQPAEQVIADLRSRLVAQLIQAGLYADEAEAMLATWDDQWFEPGVRVFYLVDPARIDQVLPMTIQPTPTQIVRAFIARAELITPDEQASILKSLASPTLPADQLAQKYGRFALIKLQNTAPSTLEDAQNRSRLIAELSTRYRTEQ